MSYYNAFKGEQKNLYLANCQNLHVGITRINKGTKQQISYSGNQKTFISKFGNRQQKPGERVEDYAAEFKRLYDKAHSKRNLETREENLLRKFLDVLAYSDAQFHVEYVNDQKILTRLSYRLLYNFEETGRAQNNKHKMVRRIKGQKSKARSESFKKFQNGSQLRGSTKQTEDQQRNKNSHAQIQ